MILGAVLAGGRARRFGTDKALALWQGQSLLDHAIAALGQHCDQVVVCGRGKAPVAAIPDRPAPDMGPLGGLNAALDYAQAHGFTRVLTCGCDTPLLPDALLADLAAREEPTFVGDLPVIGCWPAAFASQLDAWLAGQDDHSVRGWARQCGAAAIAWPGLANVNAPADLAALAAKNPSTTLPEETMNG